MNFNGAKRGLALMACAAVTLLSALPGSARAQAKPSLSLEEQVRLGERIYREGILPSGEAVQALVRGDISVPGTSFTCVSCHLRSGLGSFEGGVITPPTNGGKLFQPYKMSFKRVEPDSKFLPSINHRPAYSDETLARVTRDGVNPAGIQLNAVMPRYLLEDDDMALLTAYLKTLSVGFSPGVSETELHFATVITDEVPPAEYEAMVAPLEQYVRHKNGMIKQFKNQKRSERMAATMLESSELMYKKITLSRWMLKGAPETWRAQLEEYYRREPVFALLGGISHRDWQPVHSFSEEHHIPCLFPQTGLPVVSDTDWYTLYLSKGFYQEGEGAARYLNAATGYASGGRVLQLVRGTDEGHALARGFGQTWRDLGHEAPATLELKPGDTFGREALRQLLAKEKPSVLLIWDGPGVLPLLALLAEEPNRPATVVLAASQVGPDLGAIPEAARSFCYLTYPYRLPKDEKRNAVYIEQFKKNPKLADATDPILKGSFITTQLLTAALMDLRGNYYRDDFFDVIGMMGDQRYPLYERISFGPGQRYASKGCYIVQLGPGAQPDLVKKSDWVMY